MSWLCLLLAILLQACSMYCFGKSAGIIASETASRGADRGVSEEIDRTAASFHGRGTALGVTGAALAVAGLCAFVVGLVRKEPRRALLPVVLLIAYALLFLVQV